MTQTIIHLQPGFFERKERVLVEHDAVSASVFRFESGVAGLRLKNELGELVMLPFQGQQIWSVEFGGRNLTMQTPFTEPRPTRVFLETYGGFLLHCGATAMGVPTSDDTHPLHGELPNAPYQKAWLIVGEDERGQYIGLSGEYEHIVFFSHDYIAVPEARLYAGSSRFPVSLTVHNRKRTPMDLMYLAHVNFLPVNNGRLVYSAPCDPAHVRVRRSIPSHVHPAPGYREFLDELAEHPEKHNILAPGLSFDPEVVFFIDYKADAQGWAYTMQVHPDGTSDFIRHKLAQLNHGIRWISRTPDQDTLGMCEPATAEPEGYHAEKAKGNVRILPPGASARFEMEMGYLTAVEAEAMAAQIKGIVSQERGR